MTSTEERTAVKRAAQTVKRERREALDAARNRRDRRLAELGDHYSRDLGKLRDWYAVAKRAAWAEYRQAEQAAKGETVIDEEAA